MSFEIKIGVSLIRISEVFMPNLSQNHNILIDVLNCCNNVAFATQTNLQDCSTFFLGAKGGGV